ncbi:hypothetical protein [Streptomyces antimicrobicus]|uniref:Secreted protein n=1 Tax=Streptomyces antimicrobicus TaxID=2883108 RepID=A0ABS8B3A9_9ACTN|nr:hypothetical protein [Streptomyces antimicrobicus]MCB5179072.1 hypothetical protein [Streptomyces antimicrobicus]
MSLALLLTTAAATAVGAAALHAVHGLRKQVTALRGELAASVLPRGAAVPHARSAVGTPAADIRAAVAEALAEERERELAEARAFWAAQEARDAADAPSLLGGLPGLGEDGPVFLPRQADLVGLDPVFGDEPAGTALPEAAGEYPEDSAELAAARRRHPSHPDFVPVQPHPGADHERTVSRLEELAQARTALADVRPGPLGTLDVYVFTDGTTLCMTPGHRETAERLAEALRSGTAPVLLGGSGISGAYALTFSCGDSDDPEDNVYILADRVIASL